MVTGRTSLGHQPVNRTGEHLHIPLEFMVAFMSVYIPLILCILLGNFLVMLAVYKEKSLQNKGNFFIVSLSVADFLTGLVGVPTAIVGRLFQSQLTCSSSTRMVFFTAAFTFSAVSMFQLLALTVERYVAIMMPLVYNTKMTPARYIYTIACVWMAGVIVGVIPNFGSYSGDACDVGYEISDAVRLFMLIFAVGIPTVLAAMGLMYFHIFRKARQQANRIAALRRALHRADDPRTDQEEHSAQMKATKTTAIILGGFAACWMPMSLKFFLEVFLSMDVYTILILQTTLEFSAYANSAVNPVIYCYRNADFRTAFCKILAPLKICWCPVRRRSIQISLVEALPV